MNARATVATVELTAGQARELVGFWRENDELGYDGACVLTQEADGRVVYSCDDGRWRVGIGR